MLNLADCMWFSARSCLQFAAAMLALHKLQIESRWNSLELGRNSLASGEIKIEVRQIGDGRARFKMQFERGQVSQRQLLLSSVAFH